MKYKKVVQGIFVNRLNRFIANVCLNGEIETVHVKNTGRCKELLIEGATVYLSVEDNPKRKTKYDLIAVLKEREGKDPILVNMDSQIVNAVAEEWLKKNILFPSDANIMREVTYGNSRFDFYIETESKKAFLEVKGVTLENDGLVSFPDAPTLRGIKHLNELKKCLEEGYEAYVLFVVQMKGAEKFSPNSVLHPEFASALADAEKSGVRILCIDCIVHPDTIVSDEFIPIEL